jgi:outer membrane protein, multidrug efflux system
MRLLALCAALLLATPALAQDSISFGDAGLDDAISRALSANHDVQAARARLAQSDAMSLTALTPLLPTASFDLGVNLSPYSSRTFGSPFSSLSDLQIPGVEPEEEEEDPEVYWSGSAMLNLGWAPDVFARQAMQHKASEQDVVASRGDRDALAQATAVRVASTWWDIAAAKERIALLDEQININEAVLSLTQLRFEAGESSGLDVAQQRQQLAATKAALPGARSMLRQLRAQFAVLLAAEPGEQLPEPDAGLPTPGVRPEQPTAEQLVEARPDLRSASARVAAAEARRVSAILTLLPSLRLNGNAGLQGIYDTEIDSQWTWGAGVSLSVPLFSGLSTHAGILQTRAARGAADQTLASAELTADSQVSSAVILEEELGEQLAATDEQVDAARFAFDQSRERYVVGLAPYSSVLLALSGLQQAELSRVQVRRDLLGARISYLDATGQLALEASR